MGHVQVKHSHEPGELTSNSKMLHTKGNLVNTSHPGCESSAAEWSKSGRGDFCDYGGAVTLFPKGE